MRTAAVVFLVLVAAAPPVAPQRVSDASGHWAGSVDIPNMPIDVEVDFARSTTGQMTGTVSIPSQKTYTQGGASSPVTFARQGPGR